MILEILPSRLLPSAVFLSLILLCSNIHTASSLQEDERELEYNKRNYTFPPKCIPSTPGWTDLMYRRLHQLEFVPDSTTRYNGYVQVVTQAYVSPNFTENGWGLTRAPQGLVDELVKRLHDGMAEGPPIESDTPAIDAPPGNEPLFIDNGYLNRRALKELHPMHEEWAGIPLKGNNAYGIRVYRNESQLWMHSDIASTHVISSILHIDHDNEEGSEPWPIIIEDFQGNTNEVVLESGDMLFYESSKCLHGRPRKFKGQWYASLFTHYYPAAEDWNHQTRNLESHYGVPPRWRESQDESGLFTEKLEISGTTIYEPDCKDSWCALENSVKWSGPAKYGEVLTTGGNTFPLKTTQQQDDDPDEL